jgi:hypothetical protein
MVRLLIPPVCLPLSKYAGGEQAAAASPAKERWVLSLLWRTPEETGDDYAVFMGYDPRLEVKSFYGPLPPVMGEGVVAGVVDTGRGVLCGYGIHGSCEGGGVSYRVEFVNGSAQCRELSFRIGGLEELPRGYQVRVLNEDKMAYEEQGAQEAHGLAVGAAGKAQRVVVAGSGDYFDRVLTELARWNLQFVKAYPNPFRGLLRLYYTLPAGIREVRFTVYDMRGKALWLGTENQRTTKGAHVLLYDGSTGNSRGGYLSSGMYLIRMSAFDTEGRVAYGGQRKVFCIR